MPPILIKGDKERRARQRQKVRLQARWGRDADEWVEAEVTDLGAGGCYVGSDESVREGDIVKLMLELPGGGGRLTVRGEVAYVAERRGFGVRFSAFSGKETVPAGAAILPTY